MGSIDEGDHHVLVLPFPTQGHINPMLQFSKRVASRGLRVTLVITSTVAKSIQAQSGSVKIEFISDEHENGEKFESMKAYLERFEAVVSKGLSQLIHTRNTSDSDHPPKVLVYDSAMPWVLELAQHLGLRAASFFTQSCAVSAIYYHIHHHHLSAPLQVSQVSLPSLPVLELCDLPSFVVDLDSYPGSLDLVAKRLSNLHKADWILFNTFSKLEEKILKWMESQLLPIKTIGPTIPSIYLDKQLEDDKDYGLSLFKPSAETCMQWLDTKPKASVVYASFGSVACLPEGQMGEVAWGLNNTNRYFLWVVRESEHTKLPPNFVEQTSDRGLIVSWSPQLDVLAHQSVGCFMTHCGWNSTLEALSLGVPMVAMPQWSDQPTNAKFTEDLWQAGTRVKVDEVGLVRREEIERCIKEVMEGEKGNEMRRNAAKLGELAKEAVSTGGSSYKNIVEFVKEVVSN